MPAPAAGGKFAFQTAATHFHELAETINALPTFDDIEGKGETINELNATVLGQRHWEAAMASKAMDISAACSEQHGVDVPLSQAPTVNTVKEAEQRFAAAKGEAKIQALTEYREVKDAHDQAVETHASGTDPTPGKLGGFTVPPALSSDQSGGDTPGHRSGSHPGDGTGDDPGSGAGDGTGSGAGAGAGSGSGGSGSAGDTSLSGDTSGAGSAKPSMLGGQPMQPQAQQPPQMPPMMPQAGGAAPGAGGGMPGGMPGAGSGMGATMGPNRRKKDDDKDGKDPLDDLKTDLSGDAAAGAAGAAAGAALERGATAQHMHTKADVSGVNRPAVGSGGGGAPAPAPAGPAGGGMMGGPMGSGVGGGGDKGKRPDIKSSDKKQHGADSIADAVEGGLLGRKTAEEPVFDFERGVDDAERRKWEKP